MMKEHPILFNGDMIRAILNGRKTQTRRVIRGHPNKIHWNSIVYNGYGGWTDEHGTPFRCPFGFPGDRLWVRETFTNIDDYTGNDPGGVALIKGCFYRADYPKGDYIEDEIKRWRPSIHMPRWASRIKLEVINIRVERVQNISKKDAYAEGIPNAAYAINPISSFRFLWDSINAKRGYGWDTNPWVWVVEFKVG